MAHLERPYVRETHTHKIFRLLHCAQALALCPFTSSTFPPIRRTQQHLPTTPHLDRHLCAEPCPTPACVVLPCALLCSLVRPLINGREVGYFIFDTGASGFVLDPAVAAELGLEGFGELQVTSMVGKVASRFRCACGVPCRWSSVRQ